MDNLSIYFTKMLDNWYENKIQHVNGSIIMHLAKRKEALRSDLIPIFEAFDYYFEHCADRRE